MKNDIVTRKKMRACVANDVVTCKQQRSLRLLAAADVFPTPKLDSDHVQRPKHVSNSCI